MTISHEQLLANLANETVRWFAETNGGRQAWGSYFNQALAMHPDMPEYFRDFDNLLKADKVTFTELAYDVISDFVTWALSHPHEGDDSGGELG